MLLSLRILRWLLLTATFCAWPVWAAAPVTSIRVVLDDNYPPYVFRDANGQVQGILRDYWKLWEQRTGIAVDFAAMDWNKAQAMMANGEADVIDTLFETEERKKLFDFSAAYARIEVAIYFHQSIGGITDAESLKGFAVAAKDGDACIEYLRARGVKDFRLYPSYEAEIKAAGQHEVRILCVDRPPAEYFFAREGTAEEFRRSPPLYAGEFHRAVRKGNSELLRIVEDGFARITPEEREEIDQRWFGERLHYGAWQRAARYGGYLALFALLAFSALVVWNWSLRRRVGARTEELSLTLNSLRETEARFRKLFEQANDAIYILRGTTVLDCNQCAETLQGLPRERIVGQTPASASPPVQPNGRSSEELMHEVVTNAQSGQPVLFDWRYLRPDGSFVDAEVSLSLLDIGGETCLQAIVRDITERKLAEAEIERLAYFDTLTQLPNRRLLQDRLRQALAASKRRHAMGALLFIDLDNFKTLNDTRGHDVGDCLLKEVGHRLRKCVRAEDFIARLGGDEFVVLLEDLRQLPHEAAFDAEMVAQKIVESLRQPFLLDAYEHHSSASVGLYLFSGAPEESSEEILKRADAAMYQAKTSGRNTLCFFDPAMQQSLETRAALEAELRRALPQRQFFLAFQAKVDSERRVVGAEALLRWQHPERGLITPGQFIPVAEECGLIVAIGNWVLESACVQLREWNSLPGWENFRLAVNVSGRQFRQPDFVAAVCNIVRNSGVDARQLTLELTESSVLDNVADSIEKMHALKTLGIVFSMDDFGTGYSSLSYLKRLPLDELKIDQSFVRDISSDAGDATIVRTIIAMGQNLGLTAVAEGVESESQLEFLKRYGCTLFQGYLFGRPQSAADFVEAQRQRE